MNFQAKTQAKICSIELGPRERITSLTERDKALTFDSSAVPEWFEPTPESGQHRGLTLMLDAHNDLVASSTVPDDFEVLLRLL